MWFVCLCYALEPYPCCWMCLIYQRVGETDVLFWSDLAKPLAVRVSINISDADTLNKMTIDSFSCKI